MTAKITIIEDQKQAYSRRLQQYLDKYPWVLTEDGRMITSAPASQWERMLDLAGRIEGLKTALTIMRSVEV